MQKAVKDSNGRWRDQRGRFLSDSDVMSSDYIVPQIKWGNLGTLQCRNNTNGKDSMQHAYVGVPQQAANLMDAFVQQEFVAQSVPLQTKKFGKKIPVPFKPRTRLTEYANCCGIGIMHGFSAIYDNIHPSERKNMFRKEIDYAISMSSLRAYVFFTINKPQAKLGWKEVMDNHPNLTHVCTSNNPSHSNMTTIYTYIWFNPKATGRVSFIKEKEQSSSISKPTP